jgi:hypothetical protein
MRPDQRDRIVAVLDAATDLVVATLRPDGWPQASTVSYVNDGLDIYFGSSARSQKAENIGHDPRVSAALNPPYHAWDEIRGLSMAARAERIGDSAELARVGHLVLRKFPQVQNYVHGDPLGDLGVFRLRHVVLSVLDYSRGFGWTELVRA